VLNHRAGKGRKPKLKEKSSGPQKGVLRPVGRGLGEREELSQHKKKEGRGGKEKKRGREEKDPKKRG